MNEQPRDSFSNSINSSSLDNDPDTLTQDNTANPLSSDEVAGTTSGLSEVGGAAIEPGASRDASGVLNTDAAIFTDRSEDEDPPKHDIGDPNVSIAKFKAGGGTESLGGA